jgi:outer membrane protein TolC
VEAEQAHTAGAIKQIRSEVEQTISDVQAAKTKVEISKIQLQQAHEAVIIARTRYETGSITNLDLLDAETAESTSKLFDLQALYQYVISKFNLQQSTGTLLN